MKYRFVFSVATIRSRSHRCHRAKSEQPHNTARLQRGISRPPGCCCANSRPAMPKPSMHIAPALRWRGTNRGCRHPLKARGRRSPSWQRGARARRAGLQVGLTLLSSSCLIGDCGIRTFPDDQRLMEIGITLAPAYQGRGLATEAVLGILGSVFAELAVHRVCASVDPRNVR